MKEFMLLIRNTADHQAAWTPEQQQRFLEQCRLYIARLKEAGHLKSAQPLVRSGMILSKPKGFWQEAPLAETEEVIVGYYHIIAHDLNDAIALAKYNPEFAFSTTARIEVRSIKTKETSTNFVYPAHAA
ncbi:MAG: YciI family protein [Kiritimatiellaeota bacterium]|nr:YciI family protein [Kiritimatiellota bacterium]